MIISHPRCGTHMVRTALNNHPDIHCLSEIVNPDAKIQWLYELQRLERAKHVGMCIHKEHPNSEMILRKAQNKGCTFIRLTRENVGLAYVSRAIAKRVNRWHVNDIKQKLEIEKQLIQNPIKIDRIEMINKINETKKEFAVWLFGWKYLHITYEELIAPNSDALERIQKYIGVTPQKIEPRTVKQSYDLTKVISNYEEIMDLL